MNLLAVMSSDSGFPLIASAGIAIYISSKSAVDALVGGGAPSSGRMAIGHWIPIAVLGLAAMWTGRSQLAVGIVFSSAVACLSLAIGATSFLSPPTSAPIVRRCWAMLLPAGFLAFLAGFGGRVTGLDAAVLGFQGLLVLLIWIEREPERDRSTPADPIGPKRQNGLRAIQLLLAIALAGVGAWLAMQGIDRAAATTELASAGLLSVVMLSPILVLPIVGTGTELAQRNQSAVAVSSQVGVALLNVLALLPLLVLVAHQHVLVLKTEDLLAISRGLLPTTKPIMPMDSTVIFPLAVWRVDVVMMIALSLFLLPIAIGKWSLTKMQGAALMLGYAVYMVLSLWVGVQKV